MSRQQTVAVWANFVITKIKRKHRLSHTDFLRVTRQYGLIPFLVSNYELLHYYDIDHAADDAVKYVYEQGGEI